MHVLCLHFFSRTYFRVLTKNALFSTTTDKETVSPPSREGDYHIKKDGDTRFTL